MMTARTAVAVMAGMLAWYVHPQHAPWPAPGSVPILDLIALRNPGAYLLFRAWWFLAPLATGATLAAAVMSAWTVWGPGARRNAIARGTLPPDPFDPSSEEISLTVGELHHPIEPVESHTPSWLSIPARGLFTGVCIVGAVGAGKTSACMHPFARRLLGWRADDKERRAAALVLEVKGDFCFAVRGMLEAAGRTDDYCELSLAGEWSWNPLNEPEIDSYSLAYSVGSLLNQLFGKGKEPFWQQAYTNLVRFTIELHRLEERPWFTLQDVYRLAIAGDRFLARIEEAGQRIPAEWAAGADAEAAPVERACITAEDLAARLGELARWEWAPGSGGGYETPAGESDFKELERILRHPPRRIVPASLVLGNSGPSRTERRDLRLRFEAVQRWFLDDWAQLDQKLRTSIVEGISSFLSLFDEPGVAVAFCPPRPDPGKPAARRLLPPMEELIESGGVLALNMPVGANPALARVIGVMLKHSWLQALRRRPGRGRAGLRALAPVALRADRGHPVALLAALGDARHGVLADAAADAADQGVPEPVGRLQRRAGLEDVRPGGGAQAELLVLGVGLPAFRSRKRDAAVRLLRYSQGPPSRMEDFPRNLPLPEASWPGRPAGLPRRDAVAARGQGGDTSPSGMDWAWTREQLRKGRNPAEVRAELAARRADKSNPDQYASRTVGNAERSLAAEPRHSR